jgi:excisionase family DNA binding protein
MHEFLTLKELSDLLGTPVDTLRHWRVTGYGPKSAKIGRRVLYRRSAVEAWLDGMFE